MKLNEVLPGLFFIHNNKIKYKRFKSNEFSTCYLISFDLLNSSIKENLHNINDTQKINNNEEVILWSINNFELDFYSNKKTYWFLHNKNKDIFYNFALFHNIFCPKLPMKIKIIFIKEK